MSPEVERAVSRKHRQKRKGASKVEAEEQMSKRDKEEQTGAERDGDLAAEIDAKSEGERQELREKRGEDLSKPELMPRYTDDKRHGKHGQQKYPWRARKAQNREQGNVAPFETIEAKPHYVPITHDDLLAGFADFREWVGTHIPPGAEQEIINRGIWHASQQAAKMRDKFQQVHEQQSRLADMRAQRLQHLNPPVATTEKGA